MAESEHWHTCTLISKGGDICNKRFPTASALLSHQIHSKQHDCKLRHTLNECIWTNQCPCCSTTFASIESTKQHIIGSYQQGSCLMDLSATKWPITETFTNCKLCKFTSTNWEKCKLIYSSATCPSLAHCLSQQLVATMASRSKDSGLLSEESDDDEMKEKPQAAAGHKTKKGRTLPASLTEGSGGSSSEKKK